MKIAACILLNCFIAYLTETIKIPLSFATGCKKSMPCSNLMKEQCMKKHNGNKSGKGNSQGCNSYCANCPFNSVTIFELYKPPFYLNILYKAEYPRVKSSVLSDYVVVTWKPPNNILA